MKITVILPAMFHSGGVMGVLEYCDWLNAMGHECQVWYPATKFRGRMHPNTHIYFTESQIPDADIVIATAWETAHLVWRLPDSKGKKCYYIQHYEQWKFHETGDPLYLDPNIEATYLMPLRHIYVSKFISQVIPGGQVNGKVVHAGTDAIEPYKKDYDTPRILYPVSDILWKGTQTLLPVIKKIAAMYPNVEIASYGKPYISEQEKQRLLKWANIFVFPSWIEGFGSPPLEAAMHGCAVISTTKNAMPELFTHNEIRWVSEKNEEELYHAIAQVILNKGLRTYLGEQSQWTARQYIWENAAKNFEKVLCGI